MAPAKGFILPTIVKRKKTKAVMTHQHTANGYNEVLYYLSIKIIIHFSRNSYQEQDIVE